jgi:hypothetical protein
MAALRNVAVLCLGVVLGLTLASCQDPRSATVRYRVIATVAVDGKPVENSTVMEIKYRNADDPNVNWFIRAVMGISGTVTYTEQHGEALIVDLGERGTAFILPSSYSPYGSTGRGNFSSFYATSLLTTLGITNKLNLIDANDFAQLRNIRGRRPLRSRTDEVHPAMVAFLNEQQPETIYQVDPYNMQASFGGVRLISLDIEITDDPVTSKLPQRLPWLMGRKGKLAADHSTPVVYPLKAGDRFVTAIQERDFFAPHSYD